MAVAAVTTLLLMAAFELREELEIYGGEGA